jgi:protein-S-isoprenylcysteine O-methyltransferase Ste14
LTYGGAQADETFQLVRVAAMLWRQVKAITAFPGVMTVVIPAVILLVIGPGEGLNPTTVTRAATLVVGVLFLVLGVAMFCWTVVLFARHGKGTLAPFDAPSKLVVEGPYRHVRNPMYTAVFSIQVGEALALQSWTLLGWFLCFFAVIATFVRLKEERWLVDQFGADYEEYRAHVPRWLPRVTPWEPARRP